MTGHNDLTFFTNEPERNLYERFNKILRSNTQFFDVLVGYFRTSGFHVMYPALVDVEKIRILVGLNVDGRTVEMIEEANEQVSLEMLSFQQINEKFTKAIENEFNHSDDTYDTEKSVEIFIDWIKRGKLEMRMYMETPIHAKVYIMRKDMEKVPDQFGSIITGSSNFSMAGLKNNLEFNVELKDSRDVEFALKKFEELWAKGMDVSASYIETIKNKTWLKDDITPYELYLKTIYEYFKEEVNADKDTSLEGLLPKGYMKLKYQLDAVLDAEKKLEAFNGVFISDVVGLGKTYICAMLAKRLREGKKLIICPPVLVDYWKKVLLEFDVAAEVESLGKLEKIIQDGADEYEYIFIDEAHRFRNSNTEGFSLLRTICYNKKVILISATPINNYASDIENQIYLFQAKHNSLIPNVKDLESFFVGLNGKLKKLEKGSEEYYNQLQNNSESIRDNILRYLMIRRTRSEIVTYYGKDLKIQGLTFPVLGTPEKIVYSFDDKTDEVFKETIYIIKSLTYARYTPLLFLNDNSEYSTLLVSQKNMSGFMKSILVKRLESSFYAFKMTLSRFIESYEKFIAMCKKGEIFISKKVNVYDLLDYGDDLRLMQFIQDEKVQHFKLEAFNEEFMPSLEIDLAKLRRLKRQWETITEDPKLEQFICELNESPLLKNKIIIFTESKETANYLGENLKRIYKERVVVFSGESGEVLKKEIEYSFNPRYKDKNQDKFDVLITTDVLAEGINLHLSNVLINYDLPWNPTKIMQRVGRINRVGTEFSTIYVFNFFPTSQTDKHLPMKNRIIEKLQMFHDTLGEDFKYLSEDEKIDSYKLYDELTEGFKEEEGNNIDLQYLAEIREIRDENPTLFNKIKRLPTKCRSGKATNLVDEDTTITFLRKGALKKFFISQGQTTNELSFVNAIAYIKSDINEKIITLGENYYKHLDKNKKAFECQLNTEEIIVLNKTKIKGNDAKMIKRLKAISKCYKFTDEQDKTIMKMIELWENGEVPNQLTKRIIRQTDTTQEPIQVFFEIVRCLPNEYLRNKKAYNNEERIHKEVVLSCGMREGE